MVSLVVLWCDVGEPLGFLVVFWWFDILFSGVEHVLSGFWLSGSCCG